ncbi:MAG: LysM peptidoglycan-binding domain-containing protein [Cyclobacteriaceae bacterium]
MPLSYSLTLLFFLSFIQVYALDSLRIEKVQDKVVVIHEVEKGETLYALSKRYGAQINEVIAFNQISDNTISLGQVLKIPLVPVSGTGNKSKPETIHVVETGETLFSISQKYGLRVYQLKEMNNLNSNDISIGQELVIKKMAPEAMAEDHKTLVFSSYPAKKDSAVEVATVVPEDPAKEVVEEPMVDESDFIAYQVQSGDDLSSISTRYGVRVDSLKYWNQLISDRLDIGQELKLKQKVDVVLDAPKIVRTPYGIRKRMVDQSGFVRIIEEGIAQKIEDVIPTDKYLCLHRNQPVGSLVEVRNLMNNQKVFVKVVARLPDTGLNENVLIRLTPVAFKRLGIIDPKARVEISYYEE